MGFDQARPSTQPPNPLQKVLREVYNRPCMDALMSVLAPILVWMFFIGMVGSALVIVISAVEDFYTILEKD